MELKITKLRIVASIVTMIIFITIPCYLYIQAQSDMAYALEKYPFIIEIDYWESVTVRNAMLHLSSPWYIYYVFAILIISGVFITITILIKEI